jgi:hypothetical protein
MVGAARQDAPILSVASFRAWLASRPDEEPWELIEGVPMMMTPPNRRHQRIASNLESLLNRARMAGAKLRSVLVERGGRELHRIAANVGGPGNHRCLEPDPVAGIERPGGFLVAWFVSGQCRHEAVG